jgi:hypothetical protein
MQGPHELRFQFKQGDQLLLSKTVTVIDIIHRSSCIFKHDVSETGFCLSSDETY